MKSFFLTILCLQINLHGAAVTNPGTVEDAAFWNRLAGEELRRAKNVRPNIAVAKNVVVLLGDGMGVSTVTAARILKGQLKGQSGEEGMLSFEEFPHVALSKTYNTDAQTADSAGTATAFFAGVKTRLGVLGVDATVPLDDCDAMTEENKVDSILDWSKTAGKSVGLITTARVTHATPGALYAHTPQRDWENDKDILDVKTAGCAVKDIAAQLVDDNPDIQVILGGGREKFLMNNTMDPESGLLMAGRLDGRDLTEVWKTTQQNMGRKYKYVWNLTAFDAVDPKETDYLMGLFSKSHMSYEIDRANDAGKEPSLAEMTEKAIQILSKNPNGFFLLIEGGRIDHGHHASQSVRALHDTLAFSDATDKVLAMTSKSDTLIVTTADHSHVFTIGGYPTRGNPLFGLTDDREGDYKLGLDNKPFTTLGYTNGPGSFAATNATVRPNDTLVDTGDRDYKQQAAVPLDSETHGGEDVAIYAQGPMAHLFHGVHEQNYIAHVMAYAACLGSYSSPDSCAKADVAALKDLTSSAAIFHPSFSVFCFVILSYFLTL